MARKARADVPETEFVKTTQARLELPTADMERVRTAARKIGLSLSAFIRQSVLEKAADVEKRMG